MGASEDEFQDKMDEIINSRGIETWKRLPAETLAHILRMKVERLLDKVSDDLYKAESVTDECLDIANYARFIYKKMIEK